MKLLLEFVQDVRFALRMFRMRRGLAATAALTLALGIGVNIAMFSVINGVLIQGLPFPNPDRMVRVAELDGSPDSLQPFNAGNYMDVARDTSDVFQALAAYRVVPAATLTGLGEAVKAGTIAVRPEFFGVLGAPLQLGRPLTLADMNTESRSVVVSDTFWRAKLGADPHVVGRSVELDAQAWTIVGVMAPRMVFPAGFELWKPLVFSASDLAQRNSWSLQVIGRLRAGVTPAMASASAAHAMSIVAVEHPGPMARSAAAVDLNEDTVSRVRHDLIFVQGVAALILLIACANLANLLLAAATVRQQEFSIRASIGAGRARLIRQVMAEALTISTVGGAVGAALAYLIVPAIIAAYPGELPGRERIGVSLVELLVAIAAVVATSAIFGIAPALLASRAQLSGGLRNSERVGGSPAVRWLQNGFIAAEVVMTLSLLAGATLLVKSFATLTGQPVGFDSHNVLTAYLQVPAPRFPSDAERLAVFEHLSDRLAAEPDVVAAATTLPMPFDGSGMGAALRWDPAIGQTGPLVANLRWASPRYLDVLAVPLLAGRFIDATDRAGSPLVAVVNETFARQYGKTHDVVGMRFRRTDDGPWITIVGVAADVRVNFLQKPRSEVIFPFAQNNLVAGNFILKTRSSPARLAHRVRELTREAYPNLPLGRIEPLGVVIGDSVAARRFNMSLLGALTSLAVVLSAVGIYGVSAYVVNRRRREMGIRIALGAHPSQVQRLLMRQGLTPIIAGIAGGLAGAWFLTTLLKKELFQLQPHDPATLIISSVTFFAIGVLACWLPARRTARINPISVLKAE
jgi:predicted permease